MKTTVLALLISAFAVANTQVREAMADPVKPKHPSLTESLSLEEVLDYLNLGENKQDQAKLGLDQDSNHELGAATGVAEGSASPVASYLPSISETSNPNAVEKDDSQKHLDDLEKQLNQSLGSGQDSNHEPGEVTGVAEGAASPVASYLPSIPETSKPDAVEKDDSQNHLDVLDKQLNQSLGSDQDSNHKPGEVTGVAEGAVASYLPSIPETSNPDDVASPVGSYLPSIPITSKQDAVEEVPYDLQKHLDDSEKRRVSSRISENANGQIYTKEDPVASYLPSLLETSNPDDVKELPYDLQKFFDESEKELNQILGSDQDSNHEPKEVTGVAEGAASPGDSYLPSIPETSNPDDVASPEVPHFRSLPKNLRNYVSDKQPRDSQKHLDVPEKRRNQILGSDQDSNHEPEEVTGVAVGFGALYVPSIPETSNPGDVASPEFPNYRDIPKDLIIHVAEDYPSDSQKHLDVPEKRRIYTKEDPVSSNLLSLPETSNPDDVEKYLYNLRKDLEKQHKQAYSRGLRKTLNPDDVKKLPYHFQKVLEDSEKKLNQILGSNQRQDKSVKLLRRLEKSVTDAAEVGVPSLKDFLRLWKAEAHEVVEDVISKIDLKKRLQQLENCLSDLKDQLKEITKKHPPTLQHTKKTGVDEHYVGRIQNYLNEIKNEVREIESLLII